VFEGYSPFIKLLGAAAGLFALNTNQLFLQVSIEVHQLDLYEQIRAKMLVQVQRMDPYKQIISPDFKTGSEPR